MATDPFADPPQCSKCLKYTRTKRPVKNSETADIAMGPCMLKDRTSRLGTVGTLRKEPGSCQASKSAAGSQSGGQSKQVRANL